MSEAQRLQQAEVAGKQFVFQTQEERDIQKLNRLSALQGQAMANRAAAKSSMFGMLGSIAGVALGAGIKPG